ncbi:hypothetical protein AXF42_Ash020723 [Apostasia shenzhenica]|uniref:DUF868 domain-containing protein n=1 Tax=Apostasia shenzhenica TaxID=1088818 RepID=A0A2H9ZYC0_9ASPA|nr:hypothetical protein AXF42_Ash020723 [Apostasia shenzhenica]
MLDPIPACFRDSAAGGTPASTASGPSLTTCIYETHLGFASLSWSRTALGLSLRANLRLPPAAGDVDDCDEYDDEPIGFRIRPWIFWKRKGTQRLQLKGGPALDVAWDLSRARFPVAGGPEPCSGFFVAVAVDGEMALVAGDMEDEADRKMKPRKRTPAAPALVLRREHVLLKGDGGRRSYLTSVRFAGKEREIAIEIGGKETAAATGMCVSIDGSKVLQIRRLRWKFRGNEWVEIGGECRSRIQICWDLHSWLFPSKDDAATASFAGTAAAGIGQAVFIFRFENSDEKGKEIEYAIPGDGRAGYLYRGLIADDLGKNRNWSGGGWGERREMKKNRLKVSSSSSSSSSSSAGSSSVLEWESLEEAELCGIDGFTLVVYAWKS